MDQTAGAAAEQRQEGYAHVLLHLQRSSRRTAAKGRKRYSDYDYEEDLADDVGALSGDDDGPSPKRFRNVRFTTEDRRFGEGLVITLRVGSTDA